MQQPTSDPSENTREILASWNLPELRQQIRLAMTWFLGQLASIRHDARIDAIAFVVDAGNVSISSAWAYESDIRHIVEQHGDDNGYNNLQICNPAEYPNWNPDIQSFPGLEAEISRLSATTYADYERFGEPYLNQRWEEKLDISLCEFLIEAIHDSTLRLQKLPLSDDFLLYVHRHDADEFENYFTMKRTLSRMTLRNRLAAYEDWILAGLSD